MIVYTNPVPRGRSPKVTRCRGRIGAAAEGSGEHHDQRRPSRANLPPVLIILVVTTAVAEAARKRLVNEGASAALPGRTGRLAGAIPQVSCSWLSRCGPGAVAG